MAGGEQFSLSWDNFHRNMSSGMHALLEAEDLVDVTIAVEGRYLRAHKMVLSVCSPYFKELFRANPCQHPIVFMRDVGYEAVRHLLTFMYRGEVQVNQDNLDGFIKTAQALQIKGLTGDGNIDNLDYVDDVFRTHDPPPPDKPNLERAAKRARLSSNDDAEAIVGTPAPQEIIQFKMEPFEVVGAQDSVVSGPADEYSEGGVACGGLADDDYVEVIADDEDRLREDGAAASDPDYSVLEVKGDQEAGTSGYPDESQDRVVLKEKKLFKARKSHKIMHQGFFYNISSVRDGRKRYFRCSHKKTTGCLATAALNKYDSIDNLQIFRPHNHPPDSVMEAKYKFEMELTNAVKHSNAPIRNIYQNLAAMYPDIAKLVRYDVNLFNRLKRRRASELSANYAS